MSKQKLSGKGAETEVSDFLPGGLNVMRVERELIGDAKEKCTMETKFEKLLERIKLAIFQPESYHK